MSYAENRRLERRIERLESTVEKLISMLLDQANDGRVELERLWGTIARIETVGNPEGWGQ